MRFQRIVHPTDFDEPSKEAFRVAQHLAEALDARLVVFHIVDPPAAITQEGLIMREAVSGTPVDPWPEYRKLQSAKTNVLVEYALVVGSPAQAKHLLLQKIREVGDSVLLVMGSHGRRGINRLLWGSKAEEVVRECPCPVLVVKPASATLPEADLDASAMANT